LLIITHSLSITATVVYNGSSTASSLGPARGQRLPYVRSRRCKDRRSQGRRKQAALRVSPIHPHHLPSLRMRRLLPVELCLSLFPSIDRYIVKSMRLCVAAMCSRGVL